MGVNGSDGGVHDHGHDLIVGILGREQRILSQVMLDASWNPSSARL